ncbi:unnamed protein product [Caenorhabditis nigoni]
MQQPSTTTTLPILAKKVKKLASSKFQKLKSLLVGGEDGFSRFKKVYKLRGELGKGGFGVVYRGIRISDNHLVAVKFIEKKNVKEWGTLNDEKVPMEICMLSRCSTILGVIGLIDCYSIPAGFLIVMERPYPCIDMFDFVKGQGKLPEEMAHFLFHQIATTVQECMKNKVLHRDVKDENVVIDLATGTTKLIDFGAATELQDGHYFNFQGTIMCSPPEWLINRLYLGEEATVWSLGVLLYTALNGRLPFQTVEKICSPATVGALRFFVPLSEEVKDLIRSCLMFEPEQRCSMEDILKHSWVHKEAISWPAFTKKMVEKTLDATTHNKKASNHHDETVKVVKRVKIQPADPNHPTLYARRQGNKPHLVLKISKD